MLPVVVIYIVKTIKRGVLETDIDTHRLVDTGYLNTILSHDSTDTDEMNIIGGRTYIQIDKDDDAFKSNCITTDYTGLCGKDVLCPMLGSKIYELIDNNLKIGTNTDNKKNIFDYKEHFEQAVQNQQQEQCTCLR